MGRHPSDLEEDRTSMLKAGLFLAFFFVAVVTLANGNQTPSNEAVPRYISYGRPNSMLFMHPSRSLMDKRNKHTFYPRPNSLITAVRGKISTEASNAALRRYMSMGRPNSLIFMHPTRSLMDKRGQQIFMPRPNSMMNAIKGKRGQQIFLPRPNSLMSAIKGKRAFLHGSPNSFNFPIWSHPQFEDVEDVEDVEDEDEELYESIEKYGKRADGNFDVFLGNRG